MKTANIGPDQSVLRKGECPKLKRGERYCIPCRRIIRVGFADNGAHSYSAGHIAAVEAFRRGEK